MIRDLIEIIGFPFFLVSYSSLSFRMVCGWAVPYITLGLNLNKQSAACPPGWKSYVILPESLRVRSTVQSRSGNCPSTCSSMTAWSADQRAVMSMGAEMLTSMSELEHKRIDGGISQKPDQG